jgi:hypothetical protein
LSLWVPKTHYSLWNGVNIASGAEVKLLPVDSRHIEFEGSHAQGEHCLQHCIIANTSFELVDP